VYKDEEKKPLTDNILKNLTLNKEHLSTIEWSIKFEVKH